MQGGIFIFSERFKKERKKLKLTQEQIAKKLNTSRQNITNWETGYSIPSMELLIKCTKLFRCSADYLLGESDFRNFAEEYDSNHKDEIHVIKNNVKVLEKLPKSLQEELEINETYKTNEKHITNGQMILDVLKNLNFIPIDREITDGEIQNIISLFHKINEMIKEKELIDISDLSDKDKEQIVYMLNLMRKNQNK